MRLATHPTSVLPWAEKSFCWQVPSDAPSEQYWGGHQQAQQWPPAAGEGSATHPSGHPLDPSQPAAANWQQPEQVVGHGSAEPAYQGYGKERQQGYSVGDQVQGGETQGGEMQGYGSEQQGYEAEQQRYGGSQQGYAWVEDGQAGMGHDVPGAMRQPSGQQQWQPIQSRVGICKHSHGRFMLCERIAKFPSPPS